MIEKIIRGPEDEAQLTSESLFAPDALLPYVPEAVKAVLDYGCGDGVRGALLKERNHAVVYGIEGDAALAGAAESRLDTVWHQPPDKTPLPLERGSIDLVLGVDLLPRLRDPDPVLREIHRILQPEGIIITTVPNLQYYRTMLMLAKGRWDYEDRGIMARNHLRFFTGFEIIRLFRSMRFEVAHLSGIVQCSEEELPLDEGQYLYFENFTLGPLNETDYTGLRTEQFLVIAKHADPENRE